MSQPATETALWCDRCKEVVTEPVKTYECGNCGFVTNSEDLGGERARCESCNRFMAKSADDACGTCNEEVSEIEAVIDHDGSLVHPDEYDPDGPALAERERASAERREQERLERTTEVTWSQVMPGDAISVIDDYGINAIEVQHVLHISDDKVVALTDRHSSSRVEVHDGTETVRVERGKFLGRRAFIGEVRPADGPVYNSVMPDIVVTVDTITGMVEIRAGRDNHYSPVASVVLPDQLRTLAGLMERAVALREPDAQPSGSHVTYTSQEVWNGNVDHEVSIESGSSWQDDSPAYIFHSRRRATAVGSGAALLHVADFLRKRADALDSEAVVL